MNWMNSVDGRSVNAGCPCKPLVVMIAVSSSFVSQLCRRYTSRRMAAGSTISASRISIAFDDDPLCAHRFDPGLNQGKHSADVELTGADHIDIGACVHVKQVSVRQGRGSPIEGAGVFFQFDRVFLKTDKYSRLAEVARAVHQHLERKHRFARARAAFDQGGPPSRQPTQCDVIKAEYPGCNLLHPFVSL